MLQARGGGAGAAVKLDAAQDLGLSLCLTLASSSAAAKAAALPLFHCRPLCLPRGAPQQHMDPLQGSAVEEPGSQALGLAA